MTSNKGDENENSNSSERAPKSPVHSQSLDGQVTFRPIDFDSTTDLALLAKWANDPEIRHLTSIFQNEEDYKKVETIESIRTQYECRGPIKHQHLVDLMILLDSTPVGSADITVDPLQGITPRKNTSWYGVVIGEKHARGKGIGKKSILHLEDLSRQAGSTFAEVGMFEINLASQALFKSLGYQVVKRIPEFTYWDGRMWADVRMTKDLSNSGKT